MAMTPAPTQTKKATSSTRGRQGHAGFLDYVGVAVDSLRANKLRSFLTLLGIIIGITSIISVISIIQGLNRYWKEKVSNFGPNTFVITQFPITTDLDKLYEMIRRNPDVHSDVAEYIRRGCPSCEMVGVEAHKQVDVRAGRQSLEQIGMSGITPNILDIEGFGVDIGRPLQEFDEEHSRFSAFIGADVAA